MYSELFFQTKSLREYFTDAVELKYGTFLAVGVDHIDTLISNQQFLIARYSKFGELMGNQIVYGLSGRDGITKVFQQVKTQLFYMGVLPIGFHIYRYIYLEEILIL